MAVLKRNKGCPGAISCGMCEAAYVHVMGVIAAEGREGWGYSLLSALPLNVAFEHDGAASAVQFIVDTCREQGHGCLVMEGE